MEIGANLIWSTPLIEVKNPDHPKLKEPLVRYCYEIERQATTPIESGVTLRRKANLYESRFDFFTRPEPEIQELRQFCGQALIHGVMRLREHARRGTQQPNPSVG